MPDFREYERLNGALEDLFATFGSYLSACYPPEIAALRLNAVKNTVMGPRVREMLHETLFGRL